MLFPASLAGLHTGSFGSPNYLGNCSDLKNPGSFSGPNHPGNSSAPSHPENSSAPNHPGSFRWSKTIQGIYSHPNHSLKVSTIQNTVVIQTSHGTVVIPSSQGTLVFPAIQGTVVIPNIQRSSLYCLKRKTEFLMPMNFPL